MEKQRILSQENRFTTLPPNATMLQGRFCYDDTETNDSYIVRTASQQMDYIGEDLVLTSKIVWVSDNDYQLVLEEISDPEAVSLKIGDVLNVHLKEVTSEYYISENEINGETYVSRLNLIN